MDWFDEWGWLVQPLPEECIEECSAPGSVDDAVAYWQERLDFQVPEARAIEYLAATGAWEQEELQHADATTLARRVLWLACCQLAEDEGEWGFVLEP